MSTDQTLATLNKLAKANPQLFGGIAEKFRGRINSGQRAQGSRNNFMNMINEISARGRGLADAPALTAEDLFGDQMKRVEDSARQNANSLKSAISRSLMSGGGDVSGAAGSQLLSISQNEQQQIGDQRLQFSKLTDQINRANESRGLSLLQTGLGASQNLAGLDQNVLQAMLQRQMQEEQAKKQRRAQLLGSFINGIGSIIGGAVSPGPTGGSTATGGMG